MLGWVAGAEGLVAVGAAVFSSSMAAVVLVGLVVVGLDVVAAVASWMVEGAAVDLWVGACPLGAGPIVAGGWEGGAAAGRIQRENLSLCLN